MKTQKRLKLDNVSYTLEEPNVYLLDIAKYALDDEEYNEAEEILRADNKLRKDSAGSLEEAHSSALDG